MKVTVTEYRLPNGNKILHDVDVPDDCAEKYHELTVAGCHLAAEILTTGMISQTVEHAEGDFDITLHKPGNAEEKLATMIKRFDRATFDKWLEEMRG